MKPSDSSPAASLQALSAQTCVRRQEGVVLRAVAGEHMLVPTVSREVDLDSLFLLNATGVFVWEQMKDDSRVAELAEAVEKEFLIDSEQAAADVKVFLLSLLERKLAVPA